MQLADLIRTTTAEVIAFGCANCHARTNDPGTIVKNSNDKQRLILLQAIEQHAAHALVSTDRHGTITSFNRAAEKMVGYAAEELIGKATPAVFHDPEEVLRRSREFSEALGEEIAPGFETFVCYSDRGLENQQIWSFIRKDGGVLPILLSTTRLVSDDGEHTGYLGIAQDMSELAQKEAELEMLNRSFQAQHRRQDFALKSAGVGVWEWNIQSNELVWDQHMYDLYGICEADFDGAYQAWEKGLHPDDRVRSVSEIEDAVTGKSKFDTEFRVVWPNGEVRHIRALADLRFDADRTPIKMIGVNWDISNVKDYESRLEDSNGELSRLNDELTQFAYRTSHDLKAPLITTRRLIDFVIDDIEDGNSAEALVNARRISGIMSRLQTMIEDILLLVKADTDPGADERVDLQAALDDIHDRLSLLAEENGCEVVNTVDCDDAPQLQRARVTQILENLISNGIKYCDETQEQPAVHTRVSRRNDSLCIDVEDNGIGIPESELDNVFRMFQRCHPGRSFGSGLGMSIVKKHVDFLNGDICITSAEQGTHVQVVIPSVFSETPS